MKLYMIFSVVGCFALSCAVAFSQIRSPAITATADSAGFNTVRWNDDPRLTSETYSLYASQQPVTNPSANDVVEIASRIPVGQQVWTHRPYTSDGASRTFYYAMTVNRGDGSETPILDGVSNAGPVSNSTTPTMKVIYDSNFGSKFVLDGNLDELNVSPYADNKIRPDFVSNGAGDVRRWEAPSTDLDFEVTFVIDRSYLYMGALVIDDDPTGNGAGWEGDALELFIGLYDVNHMKSLHSWGSVMGSGEDWRISFMADGRTQSGGVYDYNFPGIDHVTRMSQSPKGYVVEAKISLASFSLGYAPDAGDYLPICIVANDEDPTHGDQTRSLVVSAGGVATNHEGWQRPSCWGCLEVVGGILLEPIRANLLENPPNTGDQAIREQTLLSLDKIFTSESDSARTAPSVIDFYTSMIDKVRDEANENVGYDVCIWMMYNEGFIVKISSVIFAFDLLDGYQEWGTKLPDELLNKIKILFISHNHIDHYDPSVAYAIMNNGGYVITPSEVSYIGNVGMLPGEELKLLGLDIKAHDGLHGDVPLRMYEVMCPNGVKILHTGDNQTSGTLPQVDSLDILLLNAWVNESGGASPVIGMHNCLAKLHPKVMIPGHIYEFGHPNNPSNRLSYEWALEVDDVTVDSKVRVMTWGERYIFEGTAGTRGPHSPLTWILEQNYPNPFNPATHIEYRIANFGFVTLKVYDVLGREVATLVNLKQTPGAYTVHFDGSKLASGVYFYRLNAGSFMQTRKMLLVK